MLKTEEVNRLKLTKHETIFSVKMVKFESADYYHFLGGSFPHKVPFIERQIFFLLRFRD